MFINILQLNVRNEKLFKLEKVGVNRQAASKVINERPNTPP